MRTLRKALTALALLGALALVPASASAHPWRFHRAPRVRVVVRPVVTAPLFPVVVVSRPAPRKIWIPGHWKWSWRAHMYVWVGGHYTWVGR